MKYADIHWADLPDRGGREQRGRRPVIIWQDSTQFPTPTILIIPLTSSLASQRIAATYFVRKSVVNGLGVDSVALVFQLGATDIRRIGMRIGRLDAADLSAIQQLARNLQMLP